MEPLLIMRCWTRFVAVAIAGVLLTGCDPQQGAGKDVLVRHHFGGLAAVASRPDLGPLRTILALPESRRQVDELARKLAVQLPTWCGAAALGANDAAALQPFMRALLEAESCLEVRTAAGRVTSWALAARLEGSPAAGRAGTELHRILGSGGVGVEGDPAAFEATIGGVPAAARFATAGAWTVIGGGREVFDDFTAAIKAGLVPVPATTNAVLNLEADLAGLARLLEWRERPPGPVDQWPHLTLAVEPRNGRLRTAATLEFAQELTLPADAWQIPTNVLRDPLVGFTAVQGADTWVGRLGLFADLGVSEWPRQLFLWSLAGDPWQQYFAAPIQSPTNLMAQLSLTLPVRVVTNMLWSGTVFSLRITNQATRVELRGIPFFAPFLDSQSSGGHEQLFGGLFPQAKIGGRPAPEGLLSQIRGRTNLVLYDWETTGRRLLVTNPPNVARPRVETNDIGRLIQFKHLAQFVRLMLSTNVMRLPTADSGDLLIPGAAWVDAALPLLGDTVTEVTRTGPAQLTLVRQSQVGLNALEILYALRWLENPGFPGWADVPDVPNRVPPARPGTAPARGAGVIPVGTPPIPASPAKP